MVSKITEPPSRSGTERPRMVITGRRAFRIACRKTTFPSGSPFARAVAT